MRQATGAAPLQLRRQAGGAAAHALPLSLIRSVDARPATADKDRPSPLTA
jgi:hypothetical protein